ncbi:hypothetical protein LCGC14_1291120 [marine sediment metagenome]|uniref:Uncharacterized protein n=1 Tax=marine sediment metagenome TaxID=412755 RepID=A0A0F9NVA5_9ZZZZ
MTKTDCVFLNKYSKSERYELYYLGLTPKKRARERRFIKRVSSLADRYI